MQLLPGHAHCAPRTAGAHGHSCWPLQRTFPWLTPPWQPVKRALVIARGGERKQRQLPPTRPHYTSTLHSTRWHKLPACTWRDTQARWWHADLRVSCAVCCPPKPLCRGSKDCIELWASQGAAWSSQHPFIVRQQLLSSTATRHFTTSSGCVARACQACAYHAVLQSSWLWSSSTPPHCFCAVVHTPLQAPPLGECTRPPQLRHCRLSR